MNLTAADERSAGWFRSTRRRKIFTQASHWKAKQHAHICRWRNSAQHPCRSQMPPKTGVQTELSPEDTTSHCAEISTHARGSPTSSMALQPAKNHARRRTGKTSTSCFSDWEKQHGGDWASALRLLQCCEMISYVLVGVLQFWGITDRFSEVPCCLAVKPKRCQWYSSRQALRSTNIYLLP